MIVKPVGIENVVNWQDNGIFADTQKPVTDDNYTLAGDVNQDNLYVGYMKEHGLKGKLSLPVLSSLGAITGRQTIGDCEVYKHVNGTTIIKGAVINPNLPDSRISLGFSADENGLQYYNNPNDSMPIKTINMAGVQKWEETDDYIIYVDKDAVMTTVENYVTGTYDLFLERKANVDGALELLRENGIEWTSEDDSKLLQDINLVQLEKIASTPTTMDEPTEIQTFETRTVPTTYECCFRTDKKTGEIYIGEGYENVNGTIPEGKPFVKSVMPSGKLSFVTNATSETHSFVGKDFSTSNSNTTIVLASTEKSNEYDYHRIRYAIESGDIQNLLFSTNYQKYGDVKAYLNSTSGNMYSTDGILKMCANMRTERMNSFKQLLIYKGNLTESELKAEKEKDINVGAYYQQENSVPLIYGIDSMKSMRVYSPALTDIEIAEEVNKNIYIPENRDGVPNYLGEVK